MAAANTDLFKKLTNNFSTTLAGAIVGAGDTSMSLGSTTNLATDTGIVLVVDRVNASGVATPLLREYIKGTVSGTNVTSLVRGVGNSTAQAHASGAVVEQVVDQTTLNDTVNGILVHAKQDGTLLTSAVQAALGLTNLNGYTPLGATFASVVYNGNHSYTGVINGADYTNVLSPGMRVQTTRATPAGVQSTSLNGTTQYWSKATPAGMTTTDNITVTAWVKPSSYAGGYILSRYDGTNGFGLRMDATGQITLFGIAGGAAARQAQTYQSLALNKWAHVAITANFAGSTFTVYLDGVAVPFAFTPGASTSFGAVGNLQVGALNGVSLFPGKIAQAAVFSSILTQTTIQNYISQGLVGTEPTLISAYNFSGNANDLSTTSANNLTSNGSVTATAPDAPWGGQASGLISATLDYGIIQSVSFSTNTTVVLQVPEGCSIDTRNAIAAVVYSSNKVPFGFPAQRTKWYVDCYLKASTILTNTANTYSSAATITVPLGEWDIEYRANIYLAGGTVDVGRFFYTSLSTSSTVLNAETTVVNGSANTREIAATTSMEVPFSITTQTPLYLLVNPGVNAGATLYLSNLGISFIRAKNAYL